MGSFDLVCARACACRLLTYLGAAHLPWTPSGIVMHESWGRWAGVSLLVPQCAFLLLAPLGCFCTASGLTYVQTATTPAPCRDRNASTGVAT